MDGERGLVGEVQVGEVYSAGRKCSGCPKYQPSPGKIMKITANQNSELWTTRLPYICHEGTDCMISQPQQHEVVDPEVAVLFQTLRSILQ